MERPFTVYFDTNFYVWLGRAEDEEADRVLKVLNEREIRNVQSSYVVLELLSGKERSDQDQNLVNRIKSLKINPYPIPFGYSRDAEVISWDVLLLAGRERKDYSEGLKDIFDKETIARSFSHIADKSLSTVQLSNVSQALRPFLEHVGLDEESTETEQATAYLKYSADLIAQLSETLPTETAKKSAKFDFTKTVTPENLADLAAEIKSTLEDPVVSRIERESQVINSVLALDDRAVNAATGNSSNKEVKKLGNSMRDALHMNAFLNHLDQIDLLQVDSRQLSMIMRKKPEHLIREKGLHNRCFSTQNLESAVLFLINYER